LAWIQGPIWRAQMARFVGLSIGVTYCATPVWYFYAPTSGVILGTPILGGLFSLQTYLLGSGSATYIYMSLTPIVWLAILGPQRPLLPG
jgi:hypothetical protein